MPSRYADSQTGAMTAIVSIKLKPVITWLGRICAPPIDCRKRPITTTNRIQHVDSRKIDGTSPMILTASIN